MLFESWENVLKRCCNIKTTWRGIKIRLKYLAHKN